MGILQQQVLANINSLGLMAWSIERADQASEGGQEQHRLKKQGRKVNRATGSTAARRRK